MEENVFSNTARDELVAETKLVDERISRKEENYGLRILSLLRQKGSRRRLSIGSIVTSETTSLGVDNIKGNVRSVSFSISHLFLHLCIRALISLG